MMIVFFSFISISLFLYPLLISIDSIYGFLAYKGTVQTGYFNSLQEVSTVDVGVIKNHFVAWWSPGQWMAPGLLVLLTGCTLGLASIIVTIFFSGLGIYGFYKVYRYFGFSIPITLISLLILILSDAFYTSFIIYQGGEVLSFAIFPWFLLFIIKLERFSWKALMLFIIFFLACFGAKTTLVVYCSIMIAYKMGEKTIYSFLNGDKKVRYSVALLWLCIPWICCCIAIYKFYLQKGPRINFFYRFNPELSDILVPVSSPLSSILSTQTIILRVQKLMMPNAEYEYISLLLYFFLGIIIIISLYAALKKLQVSKIYLCILITLYIGLVIFFTTGYLFDANIDKNVRHFKLLGFLFIPVFVSVIKNVKVLRGIVLIFLLYSITDFIYLKNKWTKSRYISINYFYRNYSNLDDIDKVDEQTYKKLIALDRSTALKIQGHSVVFFLEGNPDIAIDIKHPAVFEVNGERLGSKAYKGNGSEVFIIVSKKTIAATPDFLKRLLPDYEQFEKIDETDSYFFFRNK